MQTTNSSVVTGSNAVKYTANLSVRSSAPTGVAGGSTETGTVRPYRTYNLRSRILKL